MKKKKTVISIEFDNEKAAMHFAHWLCGAGEQDYWQWMECREEDEDGDITATQFDYHGPKNKFEFMYDNTIRTKCGRMDKQ